MTFSILFNTNIIPVFGQTPQQRQEEQLRISQVSFNEDGTGYIQLEKPNGTGLTGTITFKHILTINLNVRLNVLPPECDSFFHRPLAEAFYKIAPPEGPPSSTKPLDPATMNLSKFITEITSISPKNLTLPAEGLSMSNDSRLNIDSSIMSGGEHVSYGIVRQSGLSNDEYPDYPDCISPERQEKYAETLRLLK